MTLNSPQQTPAGSGRPDHRTVVMIAILLIAALPMVTITTFWPIYGSACALSIAVLVAVLQILREHRR
jgi:hypothetical protein